MAAKSDPPKMDEATLDRYQTNYYFEYNNQVYILNCVHNWINEEYKICETMLQNIQFENPQM